MKTIQSVTFRSTLAVLFGATAITGCGQDENTSSEANEFVNADVLSCNYRESSFTIDLSEPAASRPELVQTLLNQAGVGELCCAQPVFQSERTAAYYESCSAYSGSAWVNVDEQSGIATVQASCMRGIGDSTVHSGQFSIVAPNGDRSNWSAATVINEPFAVQPLQGRGAESPVEVEQLAASSCGDFGFGGIKRKELVNALLKLGGEQNRAFAPGKAMVVIESIEGTPASATISGRFVDLEGNAIAQQGAQQGTQQAGLSGAFSAQGVLGASVSLTELSLR